MRQNGLVSIASKHLLTGFGGFFLRAASSTICAVWEFSYKGGRQGRVGHCSKKACESGVVFYLS